MRADGLLLVNARLKIFPLQHLLQCHAAVETDHVFEGHGAEPVAVGHRLRTRGVKNFACLLTVRRRVCEHFFMGEMRPCNGATAGVADHPREIADDENCMVAEVLKLPQFSQNNRVAEMNIRGCRIDPELDAQRPAERKFIAQLIFVNDLRGALF